jgi:hypothetical protein
VILDIREAQVSDNKESLQTIVLANIQADTGRPVDHGLAKELWPMLLPRAHKVRHDFIRHGLSIPAESLHIGASLSWLGQIFLCNDCWLPICSPGITSAAQFGCSGVRSLLCTSIDPSTVARDGSDSVISLSSSEHHFISISLHLVATHQNPLRIVFNWTLLVALSGFDYLDVQNQIAPKIRITTHQSYWLWQVKLKKVTKVRETISSSIKRIHWYSRLFDRPRI